MGILDMVYWLIVVVIGVFLIYTFFKFGSNGFINSDGLYNDIKIYRNKHIDNLNKDEKKLFLEIQKIYDNFKICTLVLILVTIIYMFIS